MIDYEKRAMIEAEDKYTFRQSSQISSQTGLIGYLRADMDTDGNGFSVLYATNTNTTLGVCEAVEELGLGGKIVIVGFNSDEEELGYIRRGILDGVIIQNPYVMGYCGVRYAKQAITGASIGKQLDTGVTFVNANNMNDDYIMLMLYPDKY